MLKSYWNKKKICIIWVSIKSFALTHTHETKKNASNEKQKTKKKRRWVWGQKQIQHEWKMRNGAVKWEENRIVYDIGLQMTYKNTLCVKLSQCIYYPPCEMFILRSGFFFCFHFQKNYDLYYYYFFGMNK